MTSISPGFGTDISVRLAGAMASGSNISSSADLGGRLRFDTSKIKEREDSPIGNGNGGGEGQGAALPQDSLSLQQLKRLVGDVPRMKQPEYAYKYTQTDTLKNEISEWFTYSLSLDLSLILEAKESFEESYQTLSLPPHIPASSVPNRKPAKWTTSKDVKRKAYIMRCADLLDAAAQENRVRGLEGITYVLHGVFGETHSEEEQMHWIEKNVGLVSKVAVVEGLFNCVKGAIGREWDYTNANILGPVKKEKPTDEQRILNRKELRHSLTALYFLIEIMRRRGDEAEFVGMDEEVESFRDEVAYVSENGGLLAFLLKTISRIRWEEGVELPLTNILLLTWKTMLLVFGSIDKHLPKVKSFVRLQLGLSSEIDKTLITASPLDYHNFRQEIIQKYPAYNPPKPAFPFEMTSASFLPDITGSSSPGRPGGHGDFFLGGKGRDSLSSILDKPVHIATPAPSPPPSPGGLGGKGGKKQNFQTNQNFPFLYPPVPSTAFGGKSHCWWKESDGPIDYNDGGGVPASIQEAGDLFLSRIRVTTAMKQLWREREVFERYQRGWDTDVSKDLHEEKIVRSEGKHLRWEEKRLEAVEEIFKSQLSQLQSFVIVLHKLMLTSVSTPSTQLPTQPTQAFPEKDDAKGWSSLDDYSAAWHADNDQWKDKPSRNGNSGNGGLEYSSSSWGGFMKGKSEEEDKERMEREKLEREKEEQRRWEDLDAARTKEIMAKATTAMLLTILKWFRASHVLKFEYLCQLLMDLNYIPLVLRIMNQQEIVATVTSKTDRKEMSYFNFTNQHSLSPANAHSPCISSSPDESYPPPISRFGHQDAQANEPQLDPPFNPPESITDFSARNFFTEINMLRVLQKVVKSKAHRNLALVQYKSSTILRKALKCPQEELRYYTLKLFKGQVPYCGRKWRQSNMRVITSIYMYIRPELREDWLAGGDVDAEVEESWPQEQALRALTHFHNVRRHPDAMGVDMEMIEEEMDFFRRELEKMALGQPIEGPDADEAWEGAGVGAGGPSMYGEGAPWS
ncbi:Factor arrest protein 11 [Rhizina undulata]